jgi:hypothetical protein
MIPPVLKYSLELMYKVMSNRGSRGAMYINHYYYDKHDNVG